MGIDIEITERLLDFFNFNESGYVYYIAGLIIYILILNLAIVAYAFVDMRRRNFHIILAILVTIIILVFNIPAFIIYVILRPGKTKEEIEWEELEKKFINQEVDEFKSCYKCKTMLRGEHIYCFECGTQNRAISKCGKMIELNWEHCPYCGEKSEFYKPELNIKATKGFMHKEIKIAYLERLNDRLENKLKTINLRDVKGLARRVYKFSVRTVHALVRDIKNLSKYTIFKFKQLGGFLSKHVGSSYNKSRNGFRAKANKP